MASNAEGSAFVPAPLLPKSLGEILDSVEDTQEVTAIATDQQEDPTEETTPKDGFCVECEGMLA